MSIVLDGTAGITTPQVTTDDGEAYAPGNILGTVSESGGVPTGAIIERGSNANGEFVRYADGTMICQRTVSDLVLTGAIAVTTASFPVNFSHQPTLFCSGVFGTSNVTNFSAVANIGFVHSGTGALAQWRFAKSDTVNGVGTSATILMTAIGRWF